MKMNNKTSAQNLRKLIIITIIMLLLIPAAYATFYFVMYYDKNWIFILYAGVWISTATCLVKHLINIQADAKSRPSKLLTIIEILSIFIMILSALYFIGTGCFALFSYELAHERFHVN